MKPFARVSLPVVILSWMLTSTGLIRAGIIAVNVSGPGGAGTSIFSPGDSQVDVAKIFSSIDFIDITLTVDTPGSYTIFESRSQVPGVTNNTGKIWIDFEFTLLSAPAGSSFSSAREGGIFPPRFGAPMIGPSRVRFADGEVPSGMNSTGFAPEVTLQIGGPGQVVIREQPSIPEPATLALFSTGGIILLAYKSGCGRKTWGSVSSLTRPSHKDRRF